MKNFVNVFLVILTLATFHNLIKFYFITISKSSVSNSNYMYDVLQFYGFLISSPEPLGSQGELIGWP